MSVHQCPCGFATSDELWFLSHQARHILNGGESEAPKRDHDVSDMTVGELERARRDLEASLALSRPGSMTSVPIMAQVRAIDQELAERRGTDG